VILEAGAEPRNPGSHDRYPVAVCSRPMRSALRFAPVLTLGAALLIGGRDSRSIHAQQVAAPLTDGVPVRPIDPGGISLPSPDTSAAQDQFSFIVYGDTRGPADGQIVQPQHDDVVNVALRVIREQQQAGLPVRFVVQSGDAVSNGRYGRQWNTSFTPLIERLLQKGRVPYLFAVGNHDVGSSTDLNDEGRQIGLANTRAAMTKLWPPEGSSDRLAGYPTYAFRYGRFFFLVIDSNIAGDETQFAWAADQLRRLDRRRYPVVAAVFHHPPITSGPHGGPTVEPQSETIRRRYMPLFREHHVRLLLTGHDHLFDHYVERYDDAQGTHRIDHVVAGGGGAPIYRYSGESDLARYEQTALPQVVHLTHVVRPGATDAENPHHLVVIEVRRERLRLRVVTTVAAPFLPYGADSTWLD